ncbi:MAG: hypothetical protein HYR77_00175, partial [Ignavibacteria bacterium]|nr:hypothetical protein [Ignavibacteria bacterium]
MVLQRADGIFRTASISDAQSDIAVFRVVLNRNTGVIEFQYDNIGVGGEETTDGTLVGIQCDSLTHHATVPDVPPFNHFNRSGYPVETRLHDGLCIHYYPVVYTFTS